MTGLKKQVATALLGTAVAAGALAITATAANAEIVCNRNNNCWRVHDHYTYPAEAGVVVYGNDWRFPNAGYHWRNYPGGRGYWHEGHWHKF